MASTKTIKITYALKPPSNVETGDEPTTRTFEFSVSPVSSLSSCSNPDSSSDAKDSVKAYCADLRKALEVARNEVGDELTKWRDLVGKAELSKEPRKGKGGESGDEEDGMDEETEEGV